ncbi:response regulator transcription factor [Chryseobacterium cucumeris]|uniref:response regulator transcription factor n=1 Tax=Chryseobacterium TaxID=59732 RepID=UPI002883249D|nr:response regulator transcription factor [Chryseobacterium sp. SG20098]WNI36458.1 response regulator transcription factor [Chryseobacterium sp. SG20098]
MKSILLADDHFVVRAGTSMIIAKKYPNFRIDQVENYQELLKKIAVFSYDLLFLDIDMPGTKYELMISEIKQIDSKVNILIFSAYQDSFVIKYLTEGANGYLSKLSTTDKIIEAIESIFENGFYYSPQTVKEMFLINQKKKEINPIENLTDKEKEIAYLLIDGNGNLEISNIMNIQMSTISTYKKKIFKKLKVRNIIELFTVFKDYNKF